MLAFRHPLQLTKSPFNLTCFFLLRSHCIPFQIGQAIINTVGNKRTYDEDGAAIRSSAIEAGIPLFTALDTADAMVRVLESRSFTTEAI